MSMLYLWHPAVRNDGSVLDLIITRGDSDQVGGGSDRFVASIVDTLGISTQPNKWSIRPFRCNFYSEYWMEEGWQSKWDFVWRMVAHFRQPIAVNQPKLGYIGIDEVDDYSPMGESYRYEPFACLAVAAFMSERQAEAAARKIVEDRDLREVRRSAGAPTPVPEVVNVGGDFHLRAVLGGGDESFFKGVYPDIVVTMLEKSGGVTHAQT